MKDTYYISSGAKNGFYTLRNQYAIKIGTMDGNRIYYYDDFICILATDAGRAVEKAERMGHKVQKPQFSLEEIKRRNSELVQAEREAVEKVAEEKRIERENIIQAFLDRKVWPMGQYKEQPFSDAPDSYIMYFGGSDALGKALEAEFPHLFPTVKNIYYGEVKDKSSEEVICTESFSFESEGFNGYPQTTTVIKMVTKKGHVLVYMGSGSFYMSAGQKQNMKFTVKSHEVFN